MPLNLKQALEKASEGKTEDIKRFFEVLLDSSICIPTSKQVIQTPLVGKDKQESDTEYLFIDYEQGRAVPIFSSQDTLYEWAEKEIAYVEMPFDNFIWTLPQNTWCYLDPAQNIGKEISPWEIELFKLGKDSIEELTHGVQETEQEDFEIEEAGPNIEPAKAPLINVLEAYPLIEECYLLSLKEGESKTERALVGIKYSYEPEADKRELIIEEIDACLKDLLKKPYSEAFIVDDLYNPNSMNQTLFLDYPPFYKRLKD